MNNYRNIGQAFAFFGPSKWPMHRGGDLGDWGGRFPPNLRWGMHWFPPIFREVVLSDARERMNRAKNGLIKEFFSEIVVFLVEKDRI